MTDLDAAFVQHMWAYLYNGTTDPSKPISHPDNYWVSRVKVFDDHGSPDPNHWSCSYNKGNQIETLCYKEHSDTWNKRPKGTDERIYYFELFMKKSIPFDVLTMFFNGLNIYFAFRAHTSEWFISSSIYILSFFLIASIIGIILLGGYLSELTKINLYIASLTIIYIIIIGYIIILALLRYGYADRAAVETKKLVPIAIMMQTFALNITYYAFIIQRHTAWEECKQSGEAFHSDNIKIILIVMSILSVVFLLMCLAYFYSSGSESSTRIDPLAIDPRRTRSPYEIHA